MNSKLIRFIGLALNFLKFEVLKIAISMKHKVAEQIKLNAKALHLLYSYCLAKACLPTKAGLAQTKKTF